MVSKLVFVKTSIFVVLVVLAVSQHNRAADVSTLQQELLPPTNDGITNEAWDNKRVVLQRDGYEIVAFINKPKGRSFDALLIFHGTTADDEKSLEAAQRLSLVVGTKIQADNRSLMTVSIAYKETKVQIGDEMPECEAALLWLMNDISDVYGITINKIYLLGLSRGGFIVLRLNNKYQTSGVIAVAPGPIDFKRRCQLVEEGILPEPATSFCNMMRRAYGTTVTNPTAYESRSLLYGNLSTPKSPVLIIQGLEDKNLQISLLPALLAELSSCATCPKYQLLTLPGVRHWTFNEPKSIEAIRSFIKAH
jgi:hypothetical protein